MRQQCAKSVDNPQGQAYSAAQPPGLCLTSSVQGSEIVMTSLTHLSGVRSAPIGILKNTRPSARLLRGTQGRFLIFLTIILGSLLLGSPLPQSTELPQYPSIIVYAADDFEMLNADKHSVSAHISATTQVPSCRGRCLDPHPGAYRQWSGQQSGCWVQVWRSWPEGCQHYQWYNSCNGYWDVYPNGAPRVYWNCCVH
jgi:hypothetical protein